MRIYVFSKLCTSNFTYSGRDNLGYYSILEKAYNQLKKYIDVVPTLEYISKIIERNGYYDITNKYYTSQFRIQIEKLDE